jgi:hypothetical protein
MKLQPASWPTHGDKGSRHPRLSTVMRLGTEHRSNQAGHLVHASGILTNPLKVPMIKEEMLHALSDRIHHGVIGFNSGQSLSFIEKQVLQPLEARVWDRKELHHLIAIGEKGGAWITYDQEGKT